ncbi:MAG: glycoside hydrolase family 2 protein, partial [Prevotella sp.]|nr:glycoside hydrolase family 2 protein [Prevotella sp.]
MFKVLHIHRPTKVASTVLSCFLSLIVSINANATERHRLTSGWQFIRQDMANIWEVRRPIQAGKPESVPRWQEVTLPHCFNAFDAVDPDIQYYQGCGWYRTDIPVENPYPEGHTFLEFEGCGQKTEVYLGTEKIASHVGGYDFWQVDITEQGNNMLPLSIRCDNSRDVELIPSDLSDFNLYGGLYRHVNLVYQPHCFVRDVRIQTDDNEVIIDPRLENADHQTQVHVNIYDPEGKLVASNQKEALSEDLTFQFRIKRPQLWSPQHPSLYTCVVIADNHGIQSVERKHFGFRTFEFRKKGGFYLNGSRLLLRGTHRHEDHAGVGAAMTDEMIRSELSQIKDMGANFIRLGHYQQSDLVLHLCDSLGILVWEEIPWCRGGLGGNSYRTQARSMLTSMIQRHHHHPSVILWGLGNENDWPGDFPDFQKDSIRAFMSELNNLAHQSDPTRLTTIRRCDFCSDIVDVYSPSIWAGWYSRHFTDYREMTEQAINQYDRFFHAEWGGDSHARRHQEYPLANGKLPEDIVAGDKNGDWSETYIVKLFDWHLKEQSQIKNLTGTAFWTFKDFSTPLRPDNPIPYVNQKGVVERDGTPKESFYVFKSYWSSSPVLHIYGHTWPVRWGEADEEKEILVYSNLPRVELFLNGESQGIRRRQIQDYPA